ncbi:hypothetical protein Tco_0111039 [Tanacetum coccineum]
MLLSGCILGTSSASASANDYTSVCPSPPGCHPDAPGRSHTTVPPPSPGITSVPGLLRLATCGPGCLLRPPPGLGTVLLPAVGRRLSSPAVHASPVNTTGEDLVRDDDQPQDISEPNTDKTQNPDWFKQPPRPPTSDPEWNKRQVVLDQPEQPWFNQMVSTAKDPLTLNDLMTTPIDFSNSIELEYNMVECFKELTNRLDWNNLEGDRCPFDLTKPLPLKGRPGHLTIVVEYFFNNDLEFLKSSDLEKKYTTSITKIKAAWYEIVVIEDMTHTLFSTIKHAYDKDAEKGIKHWGERRKLWYRSQVNKFSKHNVYSTQKILGVKSVSVKKLHGYGHLEEIMVKRVDRQLYKFKEGNFVDLHLNDIEDIQLLAVHTNYFISTKVTLKLKTVRDELHHRILDFCLGYNKEMSRRKWTAIDKKRSKLMVELIDKKMREIRIIQNLERLVGARELEMDYKLMTHIV